MPMGLFIGLRIGMQNRAALHGPGGPSFETEAQTLFAAMSVEPDAARKTLINDLIAGLKADGIWAELDLLYVKAAHDAQAGRLNWKNPGTFDLIEVNSPAFHTDRGYTGDGSTVDCGRSTPRALTV